jgi:glyoxalase family protein
MASTIHGLHHITAVSGPPRENFAFYHKKLGLRFTKKTVNFDDPSTYHLYYGNYNATPGSSITFFPWQHVVQGSPSAGEATEVQYAIPSGSTPYWIERFERLGIHSEEMTGPFGETIISLSDNDGMSIKLIEDSSVSDIKTKGFGGVSDEHAIRGFYGTKLTLADTGRTAELLKEFGWTEERSEQSSVRFSSQPENNLGRYVYLEKNPELSGRFGRSSIHHIAFRVPDDKAQQEWRDALIDFGFQVTPVQNRDYFRSIYFREHGGVLFEIATDIPGFTKDEELEHLGESLQLPPWYEKHRDEIEKQLPEL